MRWPKVAWENCSIWSKGGITCRKSFQAVLFVSAQGAHRHVTHPAIHPSHDPINTYVSTDTWFCSCISIMLHFITPTPQMDIFLLLSTLVPFSWNLRLQKRTKYFCSHIIIKGFFVSRICNCSRRRMTKKIQQWQKSGWGKPHAFSHETVVSLSSSILRSQSFLESSRKMEQSRSCRVLPPFTCYAFCRLLSSLCLILLNSRRANAYQNYTVGDSLGWYDRLQVPQVNYQKWVSGKNFSLGDFLSEFPLLHTGSLGCLSHNPFHVDFLFLKWKFYLLLFDS